MSADNVCKVCEQSTEKSDKKMCLSTFWLTEKIPAAQIFVEENTKSDAKFMLLNLI